MSNPHSTSALQKLQKKRRYAENLARRRYNLSLHKKNATDNLDNYRPVTLISHYLQNLGNYNVY